MSTTRPDPDRDPLAAYVDGDPDAVRAATPHQPDDGEWEATRRAIHSRLGTGHARGRGRRAALRLVSGAAITASAAALAWVMFNGTARKDSRNEEVAEVKPAQRKPGPLVAPPPREVQPDPLAEFAVLPMASSEEVVLHRVPGEGTLPVGADPLPGVIALATNDEVELGEPDPTWPGVTVAPGSAPMIYAAKPR